jgi:hypothetical protein
VRNSGPAVRLLPSRRHLARARRSRPEFPARCQEGVWADARRQRAQVRNDLRAVGSDRSRPPHDQRGPQPARDTDLILIPAGATSAIHSRARFTRSTATLPLSAAPFSELAQARSAGTGLPFPLEFPQVQDSGGTGTPVDLRDYRIDAPGGAEYPAYAAVFSNGLLGQYYDVQGTQWTPPPLLDSPDQSVEVAGRTYDLYYEGQHLQTVAWSEHGAVYWVHNTLLDSLGNGEMLAIAEQTQPVTAVGTGAARRHVELKPAAVPARVSAAQSSTAAQLIGSLGGLIALLAVPLLAIPLLKRWRDLQDLRGELGANLGQEARLAARIAALGAGGAIAPSGGWSPRVDVVARPRLIGRTPVLVAGAVTVLNAGSIQGAAHKLAAQLRADGVKVAGTGNLAGSSPTGTEVQYAPGERAQATLRPTCSLHAHRRSSRSSLPPKPQTGRRRRSSC